MFWAYWMKKTLWIQNILYNIDNNEQCSLQYLICYFIDGERNIRTEYRVLVSSDGNHKIFKLKSTCLMTYILGYFTWKVIMVYSNQYNLGRALFTINLNNLSEPPECWWSGQPPASTLVPPRCVLHHEMTLVLDKSSFEDFRP